MTWEATLDVEAPSPQLPEVPEQGGTKRLEDAPELRGTEDFSSDSTTPLPRFGRGIPHQLRVLSPMTHASDHFRPEDVDTSTASSESSDSDSSSQGGSDVSTSNSGTLSDTSTSDGEAMSDALSPDRGVQTSTAARTAARQLGAHMSEPGDGKEIRKGRTRGAQPRSGGGADQCNLTL